MSEPGGQRCPACGTDNPPRSRFCNWCGRALAQEATPTERRKVVSVLFVDLVGSTALGERVDPETVRAVLGRYFELVRAAVEHHGGTIEKFIGDAAMAVFGVPEVHEDDALRAVRAALEIRDRLPALNDELRSGWAVELAIRTGINSGEVMADESGSGPTLVTGDTVNTAARLEQGAAAGEILVGEATARLVGSAVTLEARTALAARGKAKPLPAYRILGVAERHGSIERRLDTPLVGRQEELAWLASALDLAMDGRRAVGRTVVGDAGVGKSRLIHEFVAANRSRARVVRGRCLPYGEGITWWPVAEVVRAEAGIASEDDRATATAKLGSLLEGTTEGPDVAVRLAGLIGLSDEPVPAAEAPWALRHLLEALAAARPLIAVFDDVHWAEAAMLEALDRVVDQVRERAILLLTVARPEIEQFQPDWLGGRAEGQVRRLGPLDGREVSALVDGLFGAGMVEPAVVRRIEAASEGNPLFVEQLAAFLVETGAVRREGGRLVATGEAAGVPVPPTIGTLLAARLDRLPKADRGLAGRGSVIGREFEVAGVEELTPGPELPSLKPALASLLQREILLPDRTAGDAEAYRFRHLLLRDAAYAGLPKRERAELHERFAGWLERRFGERLGEVAEIVGYHLEQAWRLRHELGERGAALESLGHRAGERLATAGEAAWWRNDAPACRKLLERAVPLLPPGRGRAWATLVLGRAYTNSGELGRAAAAYADARAEAEAIGDEGLAARLGVHEIGLLVRTDPDRWHATAPTELRRLERVARRHRYDAGVGWALLWRGLYERGMGRLQVALALHRQALRYARLADDPYLAGRCLLTVAYAATESGQPIPRALRTCRRLLDDPRVDRLTRCELLGAIGQLRAMDGDADGGVAAARESIAMAAEMGAPDTEAGSWYELGEVFLWSDRSASAEEAARRGADMLRAMGDQANLPSALATLGIAIGRQGRVADAIAIADELRALTAGDNPGDEAAWREIRGLALMASGEPASAVVLLEEAVRYLERTEVVASQGLAWLELADARLAAGDRSGAGHAAAEALRRFEAKQARVGIRWARDRLAAAAD